MGSYIFTLLMDILISLFTNIQASLELCWVQLVSSILPENQMETLGDNPFIDGLKTIQCCLGIWPLSHTIVNQKRRILSSMIFSLEDSCIHPLIIPNVHPDDPKVTLCNSFQLAQTQDRSFINSHSSRWPQSNNLQIVPTCLSLRQILCWLMQTCG